MASEFPDQAPSLEWSEKEIYFRAGQVSVVRWLAVKHRDQQEDLLTTMELGGHN
jgi:hypothetical protein|tara:strand:+ start:740 stop:901 length:162 start_codon:yes stop_codon:yes gene_type:complete